MSSTHARHIKAILVAFVLFIATCVYMSINIEKAHASDFCYDPVYESTTDTSFSGDWVWVLEVTYHVCVSGGDKYTIVDWLRGTLLLYGHTNCGNGNITTMEMDPDNFAGGNPGIWSEACVSGNQSGYTLGSRNYWSTLLTPGMDNCYGFTFRINRQWDPDITGTSPDKCVPIY